MTRQYVYGALNRLEEAVNQAGKAALWVYGIPERWSGRDLLCPGKGISGG